MEALLLTLLLWINQNTQFDYSAANGLPAIEAAEQMTLAELMIDDEAELAGNRHTASFQNFVNQLEAVYDHDRNRILVSGRINWDSPYGRSVIVHELVHFIQYRQGVQDQVACLNALEKDAYEAQALYMAAHDIPMNFDKLTVALRSMCWENPE
ncbi:MAG: hypothetical protein P8X96_21250 [Desulfobacteraceae bacterium]